MIPFAEMLEVDATKMTDAEKQVLVREMQLKLRQAYNETPTLQLSLERRLNLAVKNVQQKPDVGEFLRIAAEQRSNQEVIADVLKLWTELFPDQAI